METIKLGTHGEVSFVVEHRLKGIEMVKSRPGPGQNIIYCTRQLRRIRFHCVAKETMDLWAFLWPIYSDYEIYLCLFPLKQ